MELAKKRMFLWMLNSGIRPSEAARSRRVAVECGSVNPMTVDREEKEEAAVREGVVTSQFVERVGGVLDDSGQLTQAQSNADPPPGGALMK